MVCLARSLVLEEEDDDDDEEEEDDDDEEEEDDDDDDDDDEEEAEPKDGTREEKCLPPMTLFRIRYLVQPYLLFGKVLGKCRPPLEVKSNTTVSQ